MIVRYGRQAVLLLVLMSSAAWGSDRVALVIGNSAYQHTTRLTNPKNDAADVSMSLRSAGFDVETVTDAGKSEMEQAISRFAGQAAGSEMAVLFYAGHGMELSGQNYLIPVDARLESEATASFQAIRLSDVMDIVGVSHLGIVFLDACRDNPLVNAMSRRAGTRSAFRGLARIEPVDNLQVVYAARDGSRASDGEGRNSPFTAALLNGLKQPGLEIRDLWGQIRQDVLEQTGRQQEPYVYGPPLSGRYYFRPPQEGPPGTDGSMLDLAYWQSAQRIGTLEAYEDYRRKYPQGQFLEQAQMQIAALSRPGPRPRPSAPSGKPGAAGHPGFATFKDCDACPEMVRIPAGSFRMGENDAQKGGDVFTSPSHRVEVPAFAIGKFELTTEEWAQCAEAGACKAGGLRSRLPIAQISWDDAQQYLNWLGDRTGKRYRLPSEAEWEYAARAGTAGRYYTGDTIFCDVARIAGAARDGASCPMGNPAPVGSFPPNPWGLHDVIGNVSEWVEDCATLPSKVSAEQLLPSPYIYAPTDGGAYRVENCSARVFRGGDFNMPRFLIGAAKRLAAKADARSPSIGFRVAVGE